jgi:hypothetical protein
MNLRFALTNAVNRAKTRKIVTRNGDIMDVDYFLADIAEGRIQGLRKNLNCCTVFEMFRDGFWVTKSGDVGLVGMSYWGGSRNGR